MHNQQTHKRIAERLSALRDASDTELNRVEEAIQKATSYSQALLEEAREPLIILDSEKRVLSVNRSFCNTFQISPDMVEGHSIYEAADGTFDIPQLRQLIEDKLSRETRVHDFELVNEFPTVGLKKLLVNACGIPVNSKQVDMVLLAFEDVTELTEAKKALSQTGDLHIANDELQKEIEKLRGAVEVHLQGREAAESQLKKITNELQAANNRLEKSAAERKQAEEEVRSLEELIDTVFQSIQERLVSCGRDFNIASRNKAE